MITLLQVSVNTGSALDDRLPTLSEIVKYYGPYLGLIIALIIAILILQYFWFRKLVLAKDEEIKRLVDREHEVSERLLHLISSEIGYKKKQQNKP